ncbi:protein of unknown function [Virgibacillus subterraneus]|uniref:DUF4178 domain-containing protein n=2 Tax=Virgibacillus TaxID=84406 RepID=A0A1H1ATT2_9BACI|nr:MULTISPECIES: DUF4178 domain-containing protein [Virgibacillus]SDQ43052.1 protein of unknown function [Virgibacillus salinus]SEQ10653.1 protein of unknown function [Virgibacillus subterraneus]
MGLFSKLFSKKEKQRSAPEERTTLSIAVGDIVTYDLRDYEVVGKITYRDGSYEWYGYQLLEGRDTLWLSAEMDDELELGIYKKIQYPISKPYPKELTYDNKTYYLEEKGTASVQGEGRSSNLKDTETNYADYSADDGSHFLSFESWGTEIEASYGYPIESYELKILAGTK